MDELGRSGGEDDRGRRVAGVGQSDAFSGADVRGHSVGQGTGVFAAAFEGIDRHVPCPVREMLATWSNAGAVRVERIDLPTAEATDEIAREVVEQRWGEASALRRAGHAALAHLEQQGVSAADVHLHGRDLVNGSDTRYFVGFQWRYAGAIHRSLTRWGGVQWLEIPHPTTVGPLTAVRIEVTNRDVLADQQAKR